MSGGINIAILGRLVLLGAIWGGSFALMRIAVQGFGPVALIQLRIALAGFVLGTAVSALRLPLEVRRLWRHYLLIGGLNSALPFLLFAHAASHLPAALLAVFNALAPGFAALFSRILLGTRTSAAAWAGMALGVAGVTVMSAGFSAGAPAMGVTGGGALAGALLSGMVAPACYGLAGTYLTWAQVRTAPFVTAFGSMAGASALLLPALAAWPAPGEPFATQWIAAGILGIVCTGLAYGLNFRLIDDLGPARAMTVTYLVPLFGAGWGWLVLAERPSPATVLGGVLVLAGTWLVVTARQATAGDPDRAGHRLTGR